MTPTSLLRGVLAAATIGLWAAPSLAQTAADDSLYRAFGGQSGLTTLVDDFVERLLKDERMAPFFKEADLKNLRSKLVTQFCQVSGGPCRLEKPDMKKPHDGQDIRMRDFNALVEVLQQAMDAQGVAFGTQNRLLALLAPMHRDIVNTP
jgi:hemoglobin